jgi:acyl-CoA dehydrogenase
MALDPESLQDLIRGVRRFVQQRLVPLEERVAEEDQVPPEVVEEMKELGLFGLSVPERYGGLGLNAEEEMYIAFELGGTFGGNRR